MRDLLPDTMVIHADHRPGLERFHDREIQLVREKHAEPSVASRDGIRCPRWNASPARCSDWARSFDPDGRA
jgi:hypothetical protein